MTPELIERFFNKECTAEEAKQVVLYLNENPAELDKYLDISEWNSVTSTSAVAEPFYDEIWRNIRNKQKKSALIVMLKKSAVAAIISAALFIGYNYFSYGGKRSPIKTALNKPLPTSQGQPVITTNNTQQIISISLQDSSLVSLYPGSVIKYEVPFQHNKRAISLTGEAMFSVAKDKTKPFIVSAGSLTTTALGTKFKITTGKNPAGSITVKLFSGKVVIRPVQPGLKGWTNDVYLFPGQQLKYAEDKMLVSVEKIITILPAKKPVLKINPAATSLSNDELTFDGTSLPYVIDRLSKYYAVKIEFNKPDINAMSFTGSFDKKDSLINILQVIGQMNDLEIIKEDKKFIVQKPAKQ